MQAGLTTFVCLQDEIPPQDKMPIRGVDGFLPYKPKAEIIASGAAAARRCPAAGSAWHVS